MQLYVPPYRKNGKMGQRLLRRDILMLADAVGGRSSHPIFHRMEIAPGAVSGKIIETPTVSCRYMEAYMVADDIKVVRLDVLFDKTTP